MTITAFASFGSCTEDDAAIYQASARNSKGIVSCSGVLEVGTMSEYMIHQRFFGKLKQKAEIKRRELEESRRRGKENIQKEQLHVINQERLLRKRRTPAGNEPPSSSPTTQDGEENVASQGTEEQQPALIDDKSDNIMAQASVGATEMKVENGNEKLNHICDPMEVVTTKQSTKEKPDEKKQCIITNGFDEVGIINPTQSNRIQEDAYEGMSLAKYLSESVKSQAAEQHQSPEIMDVDVSPVQGEKELEKERERLKEEERDRAREIEREKERERAKERKREKMRQTEQEQRAASGPSTKAATHKEPEPQHKSALTSVLHSLKDMFFGKSKKSTETAETTRRASEVIIENAIPHEIHLPPSQTPPQQVTFEQDTPKLVQESSQTTDLEVKTESLQQTQDSTSPNNIINSNSDELHANKPEDVSPTPERHLESIGATLRLSVEEQKEMPKEESSPGDVLQISHSLLFKVSSSHFSLYNLPVLSI